MIAEASIHSGQHFTGRGDGLIDLRFGMHGADIPKAATDHPDACIMHARHKAAELCPVGREGVAIITENIPVGESGDKHGAGTLYQHSVAGIRRRLSQSGHEPLPQCEHPGMRCLPLEDTDGSQGRRHGRLARIHRTRMNDLRLCDQRHPFPATHHCTDRISAAHGLGENGDVRPHIVESLRTTQREPETCNDLIQNEGDAILVAQRPDLLQEARCRQIAAVITHDRFGDDRRDILMMLLQRAPQEFHIIPGQDDELFPGSSLSGTADEKYKNAYKDAIGALAKGMKVAKDSIELLSAHMDFIGQFQNSMVEMISNDIAAKDYNKAAGWVIKYYKITANPIGAKYMDGAAKYRNADKGGANALWKEAETMLKKITSLDEWTEADRTLLKLGVMEAAECYISSKQVEKAKETMNKVAPWFESDPDFKEKYDALIN